MDTVVIKAILAIDLCHIGIDDHFGTVAAGEIDQMAFAAGAVAVAVRIADHIAGLNETAAGFGSVAAGPGCVDHTVHGVTDIDHIFLFLLLFCGIRNDEVRDPAEKRNEGNRAC